MGVLNVTPDSFSDGGRYLDTDRAVAHGLQLAAEGATIVDVGGESTRPGAVRIDTTIELARVVPVVKELAAQGITVGWCPVNGDDIHAGDFSNGWTNTQWTNFYALVGARYANT